MFRKATGRSHRSGLEGMSAFASECFFNVSICFHAEALSINATLKVAHSLHYPIHTTIITIIIVSHFSLIWDTTSHILERESSFAAKYKIQTPRFLRFWHQLSE